MVDEIETHWQRSDVGLVTGVRNDGPCNLNVGVGNRRRTHCNPVVFGCYVENRHEVTGGVRTAYHHVTAPGGVGAEGFCTNSSVVAAGGVGVEDTFAVSSVGGAGGVEAKGISAVGSVFAAGGVAVEGTETVGSVATAGGVGEIYTKAGVKLC